MELDKFWEFQKKDQFIVYFGPCNLYADYWRLHHPLSLFVDFYISNLSMHLCHRRKNVAFAQHPAHLQADKWKGWSSCWNLNQQIYANLWWQTERGIFVLTSNIPYTYTSSPSQSIIIMWCCLHLQWIICLSCYLTSSNHLKQRVDAADVTATPPQLLRAHDPRLSAGAASIGASGSLEGKTAGRFRWGYQLEKSAEHWKKNIIEIMMTNCFKNGFQDKLEGLSP